MNPCALALEALCCPADEGLFHRTASGLRCSTCGLEYPEEDGIFRLLPPGPTAQEREAVLVAAERTQRDAEAGQYDRLLGLRLLSRWEIPAVLRPLRLGAESRVAEIGCGTGRVSLPISASGARCVLMDHSLESLRVLRAKLPASERVVLAQADAARLPLRDGWATHAVSCQMLEHLPGKELRSRAIGEMARVLRPGGRLALTAYWHTPGLRLILPKEGAHSGKIYFHRFTHGELRAELGARFRVESLSGRLLYVLLANGVRL